MPRWDDIRHRQKGTERCLEKPGGHAARRAAKVMQDQATRHLDPHHVLVNTLRGLGRQNDETPVGCIDQPSEVQWG